MRGLLYLCYALAIALIIALIGAPFFHINAVGGFEYKDLVAIELAAVTVVVAVLGIGVAALAIWGYREFMKKAEDTAQDVAISAVNTYLKSEQFAQNFRAVLTDLQEKRAAEEVTPEEKITEAIFGKAPKEEPFEPLPEDEADGPDDPRNH